MTNPAAPRPRTSPENRPHAGGSKKKPDYSHDWVVAIEASVDARAAKLATMRRFHVVKELTKTKAVDVYCGGPKGCRRSFADAADTECQAKKNNEHLIGGDQRERAKRKAKVVPANATLVAGPSIDRRGVRGVVYGDA